MTTTAVPQARSWRNPYLIVACGCAMAILSFGPRATLGFFLQPMSQELGWGRDVFGLAIAIQNLLWGAALPFVGAIADRYGTLLPLSIGGLIYAAGLALMAYSTTPAMLDASTGVLIGFGLSGASFTLVLAAFGKLLPESWRTLSFGIGTAAGSFGQFLFAPFGVALIDGVGWQNALLVFGGLLVLIVPMALALATPPNAPSQAGTAPTQSRRAVHASAVRQSPRPDQ